MAFKCKIIVRYVQYKEPIPQDKNYITVEVSSPTGNSITMLIKNLGRLIDYNYQLRCSIATEKEGFYKFYINTSVMTKDETELCSTLRGILNIPWYQYMLGKFDKKQNYHITSTSETLNHTFIVKDFNLTNHEMVMYKKCSEYFKESVI